MSQSKKQPSGRRLCVDPGENTGWSVWKGARLLGGGQTDLWQFAHNVKESLVSNTGPLAEKETDLLHKGRKASENTGPFEIFIIEKFALYPWKAKDLAFNEFRTVQLIGALKLIAFDFDIEVEPQSAQIKERALAGGAEEFFIRPLHENRHQNDSIMHGFFYEQVTVRGKKLKPKADTIKP